MRFLVLGAGFALLPLYLTSPLQAQEPVPLVLSGDALSGIGTVTGIERVLVDDWGGWVALVTTDNPAVGEVVLRNGVAWASVGDPAPTLSGLELAGFGDFTQDGWSGLIWTARLSGPSAPAQAVFYEKSYGFVSGEPAGSWHSGFPPGSTWSSFDELVFAYNEFDGLLSGAIADPALPGERTFVARASEFGSVGFCCQMEAMAVEGDPAPGISERIENIRTSAWTTAMSHPGSWSYWCCDLTGPETADGCIYRRQGMGGQDLLLAREGSPSPVQGRAWGPLETPSLDVNPQGDWTLRAELDPSDPTSDGIIVRNGVEFAQEGDTRPQIAPFVLDDLGEGRAQLSLDGRALWYAHWNDSAGLCEALFFGSEIVVRAGATTLGGAALVDLASDAHAFDLAPKGRFVVFRGTFAGGGEGAFLLDLGGMQPYCNGKLNSKGCPPQMHWSGSAWPSASAGSGFFVEAKMLLSQLPGLLVYSTSGPLNAPFFGGTLCVASPLQRLPAANTGGQQPPGATCTGSLAIDFNAWIASGVDPKLAAGQQVFVQCWYRDPGFSPPNDVGLTDALKFFILP
jgi:hypothetical protein